MQEKEGNHNGEGNGQEHSSGCAWASEKDQDHRGGEQQSDAAFAQHCGDSLLYEERLIEDDMRLQLRWDIAKSLNGFFNAIDHGDRIGVTALLQNGIVNGALAVYANDVVLECGAIDGFADVG